MKVTKLLFAVIASTMFSADAFSQCINAPSNGSSISVIPCGTFSTVGVGSGTYQEFTGLLSGASYTFETCGTPFNSNLSATSGSNAPILNGTNQCGDDGSVTGSAFTATTRIHVNNDACVGWVSGQGSAVLSYRQNNNLVFTSSSADMCPGNVRTQTATPSGGTFTGAAVVGGVFTAPTTTGPYVITYTFGQCSVTQTINVVSPSTDPTSVVASPSTVCPGGGTTLSVIGGSLGLGATWTWYAGGCGTGGIVGTGASIPVSPTSTTTYYVRGEGGCNSTICASVQVVVNTVSVAPTSIIASNASICSGTTTTLTVNGGALGTGAQWLWYIGSCGGQLVGGGTSINVSPLSTATYFVRAEGPCIITTCASIVVSVTPSPVAQFTAIQSPSGCGTSDGTITVVSTGGTAPYSYSWSNGATTATNSGLPAGPYIVIVTDVAGCADQLSIAMNDPGAAQVVLASSDADNVICAGQTVTFTASGSLQYQYYVNGVPSTTQNPWITNSLQQGDQVSVLGIDPNFCSSVSAGITFTVNANPVISASVSDPSACGAADGSVTTTVTSGLPGYTYLWSAGAATTSSITGLVAAPYFVTVTDLNGCTVNGTYGLSDPGAAPVSQVSSEDPLNVICAGESVTFTASGSSTYNYFVDGVNVGAVNPYTTATLTNGQSVVPTGTDGNGCTATGNIIYMTVNPGPIISLVSNVANNTICVGQTISFFGSGGLAYEFFVGATSQGAATATTLFVGSGLQNGDVVTVIGTDNNGCAVQSAGLTVTVNPAPVAIIVSQQDPSACGAVDGSVQGGVTAGTGTAPYTYDWLFGTPGSDTYSGLAAGSYFLSVTDDAGCVATVSASLSDIGSSPVTLSSDFPSGIVCGGVPVTFTSTGATTYVYYVNGVLTSTQNPFVTSSLVNGDIIAVTGLDLQLCSATSAPVQFTVHPEVQIGIIASINPSGCQATDGAANTITIGGTPAYTYTWSPTAQGSNTPNASGLSAGVNGVTVTDANGCSDSDVVGLSDIGAAVATVTANPDDIQICAGTAVTFTATGSGSYEFFVDLLSVSLTSPYTNSAILDGQTILVEATDANGCVFTTPAITYQVSQAPAVSLTSLASTCTNISEILLTGGSPAGGTFYVDYTFNGNPQPALTNLFFPALAGAGAVPVQYIYDDPNSGCPGVATTTLMVYAPPVVDLGNDTTACVYTLDAGSGFNGYLWQPYLENTSTIQTSFTGNYSVRVLDNNGCFGYDTILIVVNPLPTPILAPAGDTIAFCTGNSVLVTANLGFNQYVWNSNPPSVNNTLAVSTTGPLTLSVTDGLGCVGTTEVYVIENQPMAVSTLTIIGQEPFCFGGSVIIDSEPGYASYLWNTGSTTQSITVTTSGSYWLTTMDGNGCIDSTTQTDAVEILVWTPVPQVDVVGGSLVVSDPQNYPGGLQWFDGNNNPIQGATSSTYVPTTTGIYSVQGTDGNGCVGSSQIFDLIIGIDEAAFDGSINVYPNPNNGQFIVDVAMNGTRTMTVELYDMVGKAVWTDGTIGVADQVRKQYDVRELPNGVYFLRVTADTQMSVVKIIKQ